MEEEVIRVGLVGYGFAAKTFHLPLISATDGIEVTAIASSRPAFVEQEVLGLAVYEDPIDLFRSDEIDVVVIASANDTHVSHAKYALLAGKHVVVEKPIAPSLNETRELMTLADKVDRIATVFQNRRWDSDFLSVRRVIDANRLGRVAHFESHFDRFQADVRDRWWERPGVAGAGIWFDLAPHLVDQVLQLFGVPDGVEASLATMREGSQVDDWAHAVLHYPHRRVILHASVLVAGGSPRFVVHGDRGSLIKHRLDGQERQLLEGVVPGSPDWGVDHDNLHFWDPQGNESVIDADRGDQRAFYRSLVNAVRGHGAPPVQPHEAIAVLAVIEAGLESSNEGRVVRPALTKAELAAWEMTSAKRAMR